MIIAEIELRQPHHGFGALRHAYRYRDGYTITIDGSMVSVCYRLTGMGVMFPTSDVLTARTEPDAPPEDDEITEPATPSRKAEPPPPPKKPAAKKP